ncbi:MAG TPA: GNAT family N-acetyltransferase [Gaiellaceae bacterium]|jgi:GNAT superfamily N-acetyltransferase|nr:GNAT family N-acetyltransferase [Gaiellaceae bacterium]
MNLVPSDGFSDAELAETFTAGYEGYEVPMQIDEKLLRMMADLYDFDLARSRVALEGGERIGLANLGVRGERGWIGGVGVVPAARRRGVGRALMEALLEVGPPVIGLEVMERNESARRLYESLGFEHVRMLEVWSLPEVPAVEAVRVEPSPLGQDDLPWQREDGSLGAGYERFELDGGAILVRAGSVLQLAAPDEDTAAGLLSRGTALSYVNVPEGDVASGALARLGGTLRVRQHEMRYQA